MKPAGDMYEIGAGKGKYFSLNVPLKDGIDDEGRRGGRCRRMYPAPLSFSAAPLTLVLLIPKAICPSFDRSSAK